MINETSRTIRDGQAYQPGLYVIKGKRTTTRGCGALNEQVQGIADTGLSLRSKSQKIVWTFGDTRTIYGIYCEASSQPYCENKKNGQGTGVIDQQNCQEGNGGIFSQRRRWLKKSIKLKQPTVMIGCANKNSLRRTPLLSLLTRNLSTLIHPPMK